LAHAHRLDVRLHELHRVVDGRQRGEGAAGAVDVDRDVTVGVHRLQAQQLRHDVVGGGVVDLDAEEDHALLEELRVRVVLPNALRGGLHEGGDDVRGLGHGGGVLGTHTVGGAAAGEVVHGVS